jgi:hypothetical protein
MFPPLDYELARAKGRDLERRLEHFGPAPRQTRRTAEATSDDHQAAILAAALDGVHDLNLDHPEGIWHPRWRSEALRV